MKGKEVSILKESESVKEYSDKLLNIVNKVKLLGFVLKDSRIVEKLLHALPAQEQRRAMRQDEAIKGTFNSQT